MHNRMKEALVLLGRLPRAVVRPPLVKLGRAEIERIRAALVEAGLLDAKAARRGVSSLPAARGLSGTHAALIPAAAFCG